VSSAPGLDVDLLDASFAPWLAEEVAFVSYGSIPGSHELHDAKCLSVSGMGAKVVTVKAFLAGLGSLPSWRGSCTCVVPTSDPSLLEQLNALNVALLEAERVATPSRWHEAQRVLEGIRAGLEPELVTSLEPVLSSAGDRVDLALAPLRRWVASEQAPQALDLLTSIVLSAKDGPPVLRRGGGAVRLLCDLLELDSYDALPLDLDAPSLRDSFRLRCLAEDHATTLTRVRAVLAALVEFHSTRERPGTGKDLLVHFTGQGPVLEDDFLTGSAALDATLLARHTPAGATAGCVLVIPATLKPLVLSWGVRAHHAVLRPSDPGPVLETALTLLGGGDLTPAAALKSARAIEA
jgi:hypothetical protein